MARVTRTLGGLPVPFTSFVGRRTEVAEIRRLLGAARLVTLTGAGGVGKTRLALETAGGLVKAFPGGVTVVDLAPVRDPFAVADAAAAALGVPDVGTRPVTESLAAHVAERRMLLVLDNCEHVTDACAQLVQHLLSAAAELRILVTSRETLRLTGEHILAVGPLPRVDAAELLGQRTVAVRPGFEITAANEAGVARLCADLDGLPLAIELAASRLRTLSVEQVLERLENRFALLTTGSRVAREHQRTLRATIDWSWELCGHDERLLWSRLSVFAGGFTLDAAEGVCSGEGIESGKVLDLLDRLAAQSLVECPGAAGSSRYRMLETIRQYGLERLAAADEDHRVRQRHRSFFVALTESLYETWFGPCQAEILIELRAEHANLLAALEYRGAADEAASRTMAPGSVTEPLGRGEQRPDSQARLTLAAALLYHWVAGGFLGEGRRQLERILAEAPEPTPARARALVAAAYLAETQYDLSAAARWLGEAEELAERLGEPVVRAHAHGHRGLSMLYRGQPGEALPHLERAVAAHTGLGNAFGEVTWRCALAIVQTVSGDPRALETGRQALAGTEEHGERWARAHLLMVLGRHAWALGDHVGARAQTVAALETLRDFGDTLGMAKMIEQLAWITASQGDHLQAGRLLGVAQSLRDDVGTTVATGDPRDEQYHARCATEVRHALGPAAYGQALADGAAIDGPAQAFACVLGGDARAEPVSRSTAAAHPLTRREHQVAALVARGMTNRRIAAELVVSSRTVESHVERILTKLGFSSRTQVAAWWERSVPAP